MTTKVRVVLDDVSSSVGGTQVLAVSASDVGPRGPAGPQGTPGSGVLSYVHTQGTPATVWHIVHNLNGYPAVTAAQLQGVDDWQVIEGDTVYDDSNVLNITFSVAVSGRAFLS